MVQQFNERMNLLIQENHDGGIYLERTTNQIKPSEEQIVVVNPNQIKHIENLGTWSTENDSIYKSKLDVANLEDVDYLDSITYSDLGQNIFSRLVSNLYVSSDEIIS